MPLIAAVLEAALTVLNWYGIKLFARINSAITVVKFAVPSLTVVALFASGFHTDHLTRGGFALHGWSAVLSAVAGGGPIYSVNGFQPPVDLSGEARNPRRDVPRSILVAIGAAVLSPAGSEFVGVAESGRTTYALSESRLLPRFFLEIETRTGASAARTSAGTTACARPGTRSPSRCSPPRSTSGRCARAWGTSSAARAPTPTAPRSSPKRSP